MTSLKNLETYTDKSFNVFNYFVVQNYATLKQFHYCSQILGYDFVLYL
jgi:hypothetical protein